MKLLLSMLVLLAVTGCAPVYQTNYAYVPPTDPKIKQCTEGCALLSLTCLQAIQTDYQECVIRAEATYNRCESSKVYAYDVNTYGLYSYNATVTPRCISNCFCTRPWCFKDSPDKCTEQYRACYQECGGVVHGTTVCVRFCK